MKAHLIRIDARDASGTAVPVFLASLDDAALCHVAGQSDQWAPAIAQLPVLSYDFFGGDFRGAIATPSAAFSVATEGVSGFGALRFASARVRVWSGELGDAFGSFTLRFDGRIKAEPEVADGTARFDAGPDDAWLDKPLLALFTGAGGLEGPSDLQGSVKPLVLGACRFAPGTLIDAVDNVYQISGCGQIEAVTKVYDRVVSLGTTVGDYGDLAALLAATIAPGRWATCLGQGLVRLGAPADGQVSFDVSGDKAGPGGFARKPGAMIRRIAHLAGGTVDTANLAALDSARPWNLSLAINAQTTARQAIQELAGSVAAVAGISWTGTLFVAPLGLGTASLTLAADGTALPPVAEVAAQPVAAPYWRLATRAEISWVVHDPASVASQYVYRGDYSATRQYRLDDWVEMPDGSSWLFIAGTPAAGVTPGSDGTKWVALTAPLDPANIGAATIDAVEDALALAAARGKLTIGGALPAVASSNVGDTHVGDDGTFYDRVGEGGILLGGFALTLAGFRPFLAWTPSASQPLRNTIVVADAAYSSANDAIDQLIGLADDGVISVNEKITKLIPEQARLAEKYAVLASQAASLGVSTSAAASAKATWDALLGALSPAWYDTSAETPVSRASFDAARDGFDGALYDLDAAIKAKAATLATWAEVSGTGKPADNATRNVVTYSASAPSSPVDGDLWVDTSGVFAVFKLRSGGAWVTGANALSAYNALSGKPVALADINTTESSKLAGIQAGATVGAPSGTNVGSTSATTVEAGANAANAGLNSDGTVKADRVVAASLDGSVLHEISFAAGSNVTASDSGAVLVQVDSVTALPSQGGRVILLVTADCEATTSSGKDFHVAFAVLQRSPHGAGTWTQVGDSWRMFYLGAVPVFIGYLDEVYDAGLPGYKFPVSGGYALAGLKVQGKADGHKLGVAAANQWIDEPPSDGDYDYRVLLVSTAVPGTATPPETGYATAKTAEMQAISIKVAA